MRSSRWSVSLVRTPRPGQQSSCCIGSRKELWLRQIGLLTTLRLMRELKWSFGLRSCSLAQREWVGGTFDHVPLCDIILLYIMLPGTPVAKGTQRAFSRT
jgi:hypothetical protein